MRITIDRENPADPAGIYWYDTCEADAPATLRKIAKELEAEMGKTASVASLGLEVDSTEVQAATKVLTELAEAAERAERAMRKLDATRVDVSVKTVGSVSVMDIKGRG